MGLPDGQKSFKIGIAVWTQYRRVTYGLTDRHLTTAKTAVWGHRAGRNCGLLIRFDSERVLFTAMPMHWHGRAPLWPETSFLSPFP